MVPPTGSGTFRRIV